MVAPLFLILVAGLSAGVVAYGTHPNWVQYNHGLEFILWSRRLQWPLVALSLIACVLLIGLAISGRRRAWWLIGLAPVLALFAHRFTTGPAAGRMNAVENPVFVATDAANVGDDDWVVGVSFGDQTFAYPNAVLYASPIVIQADHDKRMMLLWSAFANRALALSISREVRARDLEVVSTPANALLIYDGRLGTFINGLTAQTMNHARPAGFGAALPTAKMPWKQWRTLHPETRVLAPPANASRGPAPTQPLLPAWPMPPMKLDRPITARVAMAGTMQPIAVASETLTAAPLNTHADGEPIVLFREQPDAPIRAYDRHVNRPPNTPTPGVTPRPDMVLTFGPNLSPRKHPGATLVDVDTASGWDAEGAWIDGPKDAKNMKGTRMDRVPVDDGVYWGVMKFWYPDALLEIAPAAPIAVQPDRDPPETTPSPHRRTPRRSRTNAPQTR
ncbi:MAG: hypothetical protein JWL69_3276 [Phycisphaerales bacterium]|nr:hypothetical protein [Phycisphaerales bacterium]MDB5354476.1 hypothetical protein [Phycisphaerales bacterium]